MYDLFFSTSPNVYKVCIMLEEVGAHYNLIATDLRTGMQHDPARIGGGPSGKIPVLVDHASAWNKPHTVFESGAILHYLAEKHSALLPADPERRSEAMQWLFWQMGGLGPFSGQCFHFRAIAPAIAPDVENAYSHGRYEKIMSQLWGGMERRLSSRSFLADEYSIADIACYPWIRYLAPQEGREAFPNIDRWFNAVSERPAVEQAFARARKVDMGVPRNEIDTTQYPPETLGDLIATGPRQPVKAR